MSNEQKKYYLYINGKAVPVSEQVFQTYHHYGRKEEYFTYDLKTEKFSCDQEAQTATYRKYIEKDAALERRFQPVVVEEPTEEEAISNLWLEDLIRGLSPEEQGIIYQFYVLDKSERDACAALRLAQTTFRRRREALLEKLRNLLNDNS